MGSDRDTIDPNPIIDEGNPTSTAGVLSIIKLCEILQRDVNLDAPKAQYSRGWGPNSTDPSTIIAAWTMLFQDMDNKAVAITFDVTDDDSPIIVGMDIKMHTITDNIANPPRILMKRPTDNEMRRMETYMNEKSPLNTRLRLLIAPVLTTSALIGGSRRPIGTRPMTLAKRIHQMTHAHPDQTMRICKDAGWLTQELKEAIKLVSQNCQSCTLSGPPAPSRKISLTHVNMGFNVEIQADFTYLTIRGHVYPALHIVDTGTGYSALKIVQSRRAEILVNNLDIAWVFEHGAPEALSADDEFNRTPIRNALKCRSIQFNPRPARRHNKCGIVERKNGTVKRILEKLTNADSVSCPDLLVAKACYLSNCLYGNKILSAFEMAKGYAPSIAGIPSRIIPEELMRAHKRQAALRSLNRLLRSRDSRQLTAGDIKEGDKVAYFYNSSKASEKPEWRKGVVQKINSNIVEVSTGKKGRHGQVAYEDLRMMPQSELAKELLGEQSWTSDDDAEGERMPGSGTSDHTTDLLLGEDNEAQAHENESTFEQTLSGTISASPIGMVSEALMARTTEGQKEESGKSRDLGQYKESVGNINGQKMVSQEAAILHDIRDKIGTGQVTASAIAFAPSWVVEKSMKAEHDENWTGAYEEVHESDLERGANVISSHVVFKVKSNDDGSLKLKSRIVVHGNRDDERELIRSDCAAADMLIIRLVISLATMLGFNMATADIKGAYMQSGPIQRNVYVRPPRDCSRKRGMVWRLLKLPYGMADAGRQWQMRAENWLLGKAGMERIDGVNQMFVRRDSGRIKLLVAKVVDDFLITGRTEDIKAFMKELAEEFEVGKTAIGGAFKFNGCEIDVGADVIELSMWEYLDKLSAVALSRTRCKQREERATATEESAYRALAGTLMYMGNAVVPQAAMITSKMQQQLGDLRVKHIVDGNNLMKEVMTLRPYIKYRRPPGLSNIKVVSLSDAAHGGGESVYGQSGSICGILIDNAGSSERVYHAISWTSHKQKRVSYSAFGAEILAAADADDRGFDLKLSLRSILSGNEIRHELFVDARALFDTITTLHEPREYRLRKTVARMRDAFESGELDCVTWIDGKSNLSDALTKNNAELSIRLNTMLSSGIWDVNLNDEWRI